MLKKVLLTTIPSDSHMWNLVYMQLLLKERGYDVLNLGCCVPVDLLYKSTLEYNPDIIIVSTLNGHAYYEALTIINKIKVENLRDIKVIIGGNLCPLTHQYEECSKELIKAGYDGVFFGKDSVIKLLEYLQGVVYE